VKLDLLIIHISFGDGKSAELANLSRTTQHSSRFEIHKILVYQLSLLLLPCVRDGLPLILLDQASQCVLTYDIESNSSNLPYTLRSAAI
jgi:hypothetical protein